MVRENKQQGVRGRGAGGNPPNRFETISYVRDDDDADKTQFLKDASRSVITTNDSPDVGFDASINPYRGCEHGCVYCLAGETPILMADGTTKPLEAIRMGDEIIGTVRKGWYRSYTRTRVLAHWEVSKPAYRIILQDGTQLITSGDHRFLTERGWKFVYGDGRPHLTTNNKLMGVGAFASPPDETPDYRIGYLCGIIRGDGHLASYEYSRKGRVHGNQHQFRLALADREGLRRASGYLSGFGIRTHEFVFQQASNDRRALSGIRTHAEGSVGRIRNMVSWPHKPSVDWCKGFLAGIFDAEGSYSGGILRITNTDDAIIEQIGHSLRRFDIKCVVETRSRPSRPLHSVRILGGLRECLRFLHTVHPVITRKSNVEGQSIKHDAALGVVSIEPLDGQWTLFDITTGTGDFIANGVVSHNCYARPTHEYLGFSAGLDFESKILVKEEAPALLRKQLSSPSWTPQVLAMSGVTDPYQPVERRLKLTRACLTVLAEFRNPVSVITKNYLVTRDRDMLERLNRYGAASVAVSITTLDRTLAGVMEPRTSRPSRRLEAIRHLAEAGIPTGVMVAPVIPGLTDHELPGIVETAAQAGAMFAGYLILRLPHGVKSVFERWLEEAVPEKKNKVLNRIRDMRGGKLNDPRFYSRHRGEGIFADQIARMFSLACSKAGIDRQGPALSTEAFRRPGKRQLDLFPD